MSELPTRRAELRSAERGRGRRARRRLGIILGGIAGLVVVALGVTVAVIGIPQFGSVAEEEVIVSGPIPRPATNEAFEPRARFNSALYSIDDPNSLWVVVNKLRPFDPTSFEPSGLVAVPVPYVNYAQLQKVASDAVVEMFADFESETGLQMQALSTYRSYAAQQQVYGGNDLLTARPGYSEHQTGLVIDIDALPRACSLQSCFADTPQGSWLAENAWKFGFIMRYPDGLTDITGYQFEPWHYRYVGLELSTEMHETGIQTLEEFFDLPPAPAYN